MLLATSVEAVARRWPDRVAVVDGSRSLTYAQLWSAQRSAAAGLVESGLRVGDRLAVVTPNCLEMVVTYHAAFLAGVVLVPVNPRLAIPEIGYLLDHSRATGLVAHHTLTSRLPAGNNDISAERIWVIGGESDTFDRLSHHADPARARPPQLATDAVAAILYTSGTTSRPKGVTHTHATLWNTAANQAWTQQFGPDDVHLVSLSAAHIAGFAGQLLTAAYAGGCVVMIADPTPTSLLDAIEQHRPTFLQMTPGVLAEMLDEVSSPGQLAGVRCCLIGGDKVPQSTYDYYRDVTGRSLTEVCGMTEALSYLMNPPFDGQRAGSIGLPVHGTRVRVARADGSAAAPGEVGELCIQSAATMVGYWEDPDRTAEVLREGWVHSGDMGRVDDDGWFYFAARRPDMIIRRDENVSPLEVEGVLTDHPAVAEAAVVGVPDAVLGQQVAAVVKLHPGAVTTTAELLGYAAERLAAYETPERLEIVDELPRNATGKVDRKAVLSLLTPPNQHHA